MSHTSIAYSGKLILDTKTRTAIKHNNGTTNLFRLLVSILSKENFKTTTLPSYFMLYANTEANILASPFVQSHSSKQLLNTYVSVVSQSESSNDLYSATFTATVDSSMLIGALAHDNKNITLALIDGARENILAVVDFDMATYNIVNGGGQTYVKWVMTFANAEAASSANIINLLEE